jgi:hypothetical protein
MTADTARLRALLAEATPGPWERRVPTVEGVFPPHIVRVDRDDQNRRRTTILAEAFQTRGPDIDDVKAGANATLVVEAVNAFPALLDRLERAEAALRDAYTLLISAEPTLIRDARTGPNEVSLHYKALLRDRVTAWLDPYRDNFDGGLAALAASEPPAPEEARPMAARGDIASIVMDPWYEVRCMQVCGWKAMKGTTAEARGHVAETGHETARLRQSSIHYRLRRAEAPK